MIVSKEDLDYYLEADKIALGITRKRPRLFGDEIWRYQRTLRKLEYYLNCRKSLIYKPVFLYYKLQFHLMSLLLGFTISANTFGPGLSIAHRGTIVVNKFVKVGANCRIHACVNIGTSAGYADKVPQIGNNVYIGPGAKIFGDIIIADNIAIGANSVVNKSFSETSISIGGIPARKISDRGSNEFFIKLPDIYSTVALLND